MNIKKAIDEFLNKASEKRKQLEVFLVNGVTLRGNIDIWDDNNIIISGYDKKNKKDIRSLVNINQIISIKEK
jgi:RNA chaperone Hfq